MFKLVMEKFITDREAHIYELMRSHAFYSEKTKKRSICKISASSIAKKFGVRREKVATKIKNLEKAGLVIPQYHVKIGDKVQVFTDLAFIDKNLGRLSIKFTEYIIKNLPNEIQARKDFKHAKQSKLKK